jgi:hypothetical protein
VNPRDRWQRLRRAGLAVVLAGAAAACFWLFLIVKRQSGQPGWAGAFLAVAGFAAAVAALAQVLLAWLQLRQGARAKPAEQLAPHERRDREARDRLRQHLGRRDRLPQMDRASARDLRVHPAIALPQPRKPEAAPSAETGSRAGRRRRFPLRPRHIQPGKPPTPGQEQYLPAFVPRDKGPEIREWMRQARDDGGFLVLVGDSSVGKTRLLYEAAREVLGDFSVLAPDLGDGDLVNKIAGASFPLPRMVVWLDELQRFLDGPYFTTPEYKPVTSAAIRLLLDARSPVIILGTLWPDHDQDLRETEPGPAKQPRHPNARDVLDDRWLHAVYLKTFSGVEREKARGLRLRDPRLEEALTYRDYGVTEVLAGAPQLMRRYEQASEEQQAVLNAAIDARRLGIQAPLTKALLRAAVGGYLSTLHSDDTWLDPVLADLIQPDRATAPLIPVLNQAKREIVGYTVADYLLQHASRERRSVRVPASTWDAALRHIRNPDDASRLAHSARYRMLYCYAIPLYRRAADAGNTWAARPLADLLTAREDLDGLRVLAASDRYAAMRLVGLLKERGDLEKAEIVEAEIADDENPAEGSARADGWRAAAGAARQLAARGDLDGLRALVNTGSRWALDALIDLLEERGDLDGLRDLADAGDWHAARRLAFVLEERGDLAGAEQLLREWVKAGDDSAAMELTYMLEERGDLDGLRDLADAGIGRAATRLAELLERRGDLAGAEELVRGCIDAGYAAITFQGRVQVGWRLTSLLKQQGRAEEAERLRRFGLNPDGSIADDDPGNPQSQPATRTLPSTP